MINLLPPDLKEKRHTQSRIYGITTFYIVGIAVVVLGPAVIMTYNLALHSTVDNLTNQVQILERQKSNNTELISRAAFIEDRLRNASTYQDSVKWDEILDQIAQATPTDSQISDIKMATQADQTTRFTLTGSTTDRRSVVLFADKLNENKNFAEATIDSITDSVNVTPKTFQFIISFHLASKAK